MSTGRQSPSVLFAVAEAYPFVKVGGLADVGGALPKALARMGLDVSLYLPQHPTMEPGSPVGSLFVRMGRRAVPVRVCSLGEHAGVRVYTVGPIVPADRDRPYAYQEEDVAAFILYSKAIVEVAAARSPAPDVIHCHDWHAGLVPQYARFGPHRRLLERTGILLTIHNLAYQGPVAGGNARLIGLDGSKGGTLLARGIEHADTINTVSPTYLREILTHENGMGLDPLLRARTDDLEGILNGVDYEEFDPATDANIVHPYDLAGLGAKGLNKADLQRRSGLAERPDAPVIGVVARLVTQKGIDLVLAAVDGLVALGTQLVVAGVGEEQYEAALESAVARHPGLVAYQPDSGETTARRIYAGADFLLAPSDYEPCGLSPLIALRYGTIPIVRRTGGMADTIEDLGASPVTGLGFTFTSKSADELLASVSRALRARRNGAWPALRRRAMLADFSWERPAEAYVRLYRRTLDRRGARGERSA